MASDTDALQRNRLAWLVSYPKELSPNFCKIYFVSNLLMRHNAILLASVPALGTTGGINGQC